jgi:RNA polymerase II subunit A small phosphatase-like protein
MKFGKRLTAEASRSPWPQHYINYRALKNAIKEDIVNGDYAQGHGGVFYDVLTSEINKTNKFYSIREQKLEEALDVLTAPGISLPPLPSQVADLEASIRQLRTFGTLNSIAVVKACKKRYRHFVEAAIANQQVPSSVPPLHAIDLLVQMAHFFTSTMLAALQTRAEILSKELLESQSSSSSSSPSTTIAILEDFQCAICLSTLQSPVVLSCAHRFCWGCLVAHACASSPSLTYWEARAETKGGPNATIATTNNDSSSSESPLKEEDTITTAKEQQQYTSSPRTVVATYACPCCRKEQILDLDRLEVDPHLDAYIKSKQSQKRQIALSTTNSSETTITTAKHVMEQKRTSSFTSIFGFFSSSSSIASLATINEEELPPSPSISSYLLPPPGDDHYPGKLTLCLDLDGTLISAFSPKKAPMLPAGAISYIVGRGSKLNPGGIFIVERPGLGEFLRRMSAVTEVVIFTAGLQDYAGPILDALEMRYGPCFTYRLYRPATVPHRLYACVKDLSRLGRDLSRVLLLDDTPLAFLSQASNGIPILQFKGDCDDTILMDAVGPLVESLAEGGGKCDIRDVLYERFAMHQWFEGQGLLDSQQ